MYDVILKFILKRSSSLLSSHCSVQLQAKAVGVRRASIVLQASVWPGLRAGSMWPIRSGSRVLSTSFCGT